MGDFLQGVYTRIALFWQSGSFRRLAKFGGFMILTFALIAGTNSFFGSRRDAQAISGQQSGIKDFQDDANLPFEFQFIGQGKITGGSDDEWLIGNVPIHVGEQTLLNNVLHPGDFVTLSGRILDNDIWLADRIELAHKGKTFFTFNGPLKWIQGITWRVGGNSLLTDQHTQIGSNLALNDLLLATFTVMENGGWLALEIKAFERFPLEPTPIASPTPTRSPTPTVAPIRSEVSAPRPSSHSRGARGKKDRPPKSKNNSHSKGKGHRKGGK